MKDTILTTAIMKRMTELADQDAEEQKEKVLAAFRDKIHPIVLVEFIKADGTVRRMRCTTDEELIPQKEDTKGQTQTKTRRRSEDVMVVWDLEKEGWRSFRFDSVLSCRPAPLDA